MDTLTLRSKPFSDKEDLLFMCFNCNTTNPLLNQHGDSCYNDKCGHPIIRDIITFEALPLVEFTVPHGMSVHEVKRLIGTSSGSGSSGGGGQEQYGGANVMRMDGPDDQGGEDAFAELLVSHQAMATGEGFEPVRVNQQVLSTMPREEVYCMKPMHPDLPWRYFKAMLPDIPFTLQEDSGLFFREEDLEFYMLQHGEAPLTRAKEVAGFGRKH